MLWSSSPSAYYRHSKHSTLLTPLGLLPTLQALLHTPNLPRFCPSLCSLPPHCCAEVAPGTDDAMEASAQELPPGPGPASVNPNAAASRPLPPPPGPPPQFAQQQQRQHPHMLPPPPGPPPGMMLPPPPGPPPGARPPPPGQMHGHGMLPPPPGPPPGMMLPPPPGPPPMFMMQMRPLPPPMGPPPLSASFNPPQQQQQQQQLQRPQQEQQEQPDSLAAAQRPKADAAKTSTITAASTVVKRPLAQNDKSVISMVPASVRVRRDDARLGAKQGVGGGSRPLGPVVGPGFGLAPTSRPAVRPAEPAATAAAAPASTDSKYLEFMQTMSDLGAFEAA